MLPIRMIETERDDFDGPIVELWRDDEFIGMVFWDGEAPIVQIYPTAEGDVHDLDANELVNLLDSAIRIVDENALDDDLGELRLVVAEEGVSEDWDDAHPATVELLGEFDPKAVHRTEDGEGFFSRADAMSFVARCEEIDLAVTEMEGFDLVAGTLAPQPDLVMDVAAQPTMSWPQFRTFANTTCQDTLSRWPDRESLVVAFVFQQPDGEDIVA